jgi:hypothetical protein
MRLILSDASLQIILEEQYFLSSKSNISIMESNGMPLWEIEFMVNQLIKELKEKKNILDPTSLN